MRASNSNDSGFTLVEVLISLFIFALISAGTMGAMFQTFAAKDRLDIASAELADIEAFRSILRADMGAMDLRPMRDGVGGTERFFVTTRNPEDSAALLTFTRLGRSNPAGDARGQAERVRYIFRDNQFIRESLRHENPAQRDEWSGRVLLEGIEDVKVAYRATMPFEGSQGIVVTREEWTIKDAAAYAREAAQDAIEFKLIDARGFETVYLFELGL